MAVLEKNVATDTFVSVSPATGEEIATYEGHTAAEVEQILQDVAAAQREWKKLSYAERAPYFVAIAKQLREEAPALAEMMAKEMGKPLAQGLAEVEKCAINCEFYAERGASFLEDEPLELKGSRIVHDPLGTVLAVMPWNYPFWQVLRCVAPVLMAGNAMVLKHASNVMGSGILIEEVLERAGLPKNMFRNLKVGVSQVADIIKHPKVAAVTLTGSERAGIAVGSTAGAALKPCVLELGGSDAYVVLEDADIDEAAKVGATARFQNAGQSCIAAKRFIVTDAVYDRFVERFVAEASKIKMGDPLEEGTEIGPVARVDLRDELHDQVGRSVKAGAKLALGGEVPDQPGAYYPPTILTEVKPGMAAFDEETFGPAAAVIRVKDEAEAIELANRSEFGLGGSVWSKDLDRANRVAGQIESGMVFINSMTRSDPRLPFGGIKNSGFGRELWIQGIRSFTNTKLVSQG